MHMENTLRPGQFVKIVNILGAKKESILECPFERSESDVPGIRLSRGRGAAAHGIEIPNQSRITAPCVRGSDFLAAVFAPQAACIAKRGNAALRADACTGKNEKPVATSDGNCRHTVSAR